MDDETLYKLYEKKFDQIYHLNDLDWRYMTTIGTLIAALNVMLTIEGVPPKFIWGLLLVLSFAGLMSILVNFRNMQLRLIIISNIEKKLGLYKDDIIPPTMEYTKPKNWTGFLTKIVTSIRLGILAIYMFVMFFSINKLVVLPLSSLISAFCVLLIFGILLYLQFDKFQKETSNLNR